MNEFLLIFRRDFKTPENQPSPDQMQGMMKAWNDWMGSIAGQDKLVNAGNRLDPNGQVVHKDKSVVNGPYVEVKEGIGGYMIVRAASLQEAAEISKGCPVLSIGGSVEVRAIVPM